MTGELSDLTMTRDGKWRLTITVNDDVRKLFDSLKGTEVNVDIKKAQKKRSLNANAYAWTLIDKIAAVLHISKEEVYREQIRSIGGVSQIVCVQDKAVDRLREVWSHQGLGWQSETMDSKIGSCTNLILYYGSSVYDSTQMACLIDKLIQDAEALGIPTLPTDEVSAMVTRWGNGE